MNIDSVSVLCYVRKNPDSTMEHIQKELKLTDTKFKLAVEQLKGKGLVKVSANLKITAVEAPVKKERKEAKKTID